MNDVQGPSMKMSQNSSQGQLFVFSSGQRSGSRISNEKLNCLSCSITTCCAILPLFLLKDTLNVRTCFSDLNWLLRMPFEVLRVFSMVFLLSWVVNFVYNYVRVFGYLKLDSVGITSDSQSTQCRPVCVYVWGGTLFVWRKDIRIHVSNVAVSLPCCP